MSELQGLPTIVQWDINGLLTGRKIGDGAFRDVYALDHTPGCVLKVEKADSTEFANVTEWRTWEAVKGTPLERFFAPCVAISAAGLALIMRHCPAVPEKHWPKEWPDVLMNDFRPANIGMYRGRAVMVDYGRHGLLQDGIANFKMVPAKKRSWNFRTATP